MVVLETIAGWSDRVDTAVANGALTCAEPLVDRWDQYEWEGSLADLLALSDRRSTYYDRPTIGAAYAFWYHGRRVNPLVDIVADIVADTVSITQADVVEFVDLGSGTGALAWACGVVTVANRACGSRCPRLVVHEVESSPFMREAANALWDAFESEFESGVERKQTKTSWPLVDRTSWPFFDVSSGCPVWVVASYVLEASDNLQGEDVASSLLIVAERCRAAGVVVVNTRANQEAITEIEQRFLGQDWNLERKNVNCVWTGPMRATFEQRREVYERVGLADRREVQRSPDFDEPSSQSIAVIHPPDRQHPLFDNPLSRRLSPEQMDVYNIGIDTPVLVRGCAGSGKSFLLVEHLVRLIQRSPADGPRKILVTAFNKGMIDQLAQWLADALEEAGATYNRVQSYESGWHWFVDAGVAGDEVLLGNFDKIPTRLAQVPWQPLNPSAWEREAAAEARRLRSEDDRFRGLDETGRVLDPGFIHQEHRRVIYGLGAITREGYLGISRVGRGQRLGPIQRDFVWQVIDNVSSRNFEHQRIKMLEKVRRGDIQPMFTDLVVDEAQDFLDADIECLSFMCGSTRSRFFVADASQALHIGHSYRPLPLPGSRWNFQELRGSFRLPAAIARAVRPLAEHVRVNRQGVGQEGTDACLPESRRGETVGVRPIVIVGDENDLCQQIACLVDSYEQYVDSVDGQHKLSVFEWDRELCRLLANGLGPRVEDATVLKLKGLERQIVVWSVRSPFTNPDEVVESVYTICTRSICLLVIAIDPGTVPDGNLEALRLFDSEHLMFWNRVSKGWWRNEIGGGEEPF